jgi:hypothetical protein
VHLAADFSKLLQPIVVKVDSFDMELGMNYFSCVPFQVEQSAG